MTESLIDKIKILRERTGVGIKDCKNALLKTDGSLDKSILELRKLGILKAESLVKRDAKEGQIAVFISSDKKRGVILELNSETDFVSRQDRFKDFVFELAELAVNNFLLEKSDLLCFSKDDKIVNDLVLDLISSYGENISIGRYKYIAVDNGFLSYYVHGTKTGKIGTLVHFTGNDFNLAYDIAMHISAMNPLYLSYNLISNDVIEKERSVFYSEAKNLHSEKDPSVLDKIVNGKLNKYLDSIILLKQCFVKAPNFTIESIIKDKIEILDYIKFEVGK